MTAQLFADRLSAEGIPVFEVRPGIIDTDMTKAVHEKYQTLIQEGLLPIPRFGTPHDVAKAVLACASGLIDYSFRHLPKFCFAESSEALHQHAGTDHPGSNGERDRQYPL